jgi:hypothetical protein
METAMTAVPGTKYAKSGDIHIAYQVVGKSPLDVSPGHQRAAVERLSHRIRPTLAEDAVAL